MGKDSGTYTEKLSEPGVTEIVNHNKQIFQPYCDLVETALSNLRSNLLNNPDSFAQQENDEVEQMLATTQLPETNSDDEAEIFPEDENVAASSSGCPIFMPDDDLNTLIRSLNGNQKNGL